MLSALRASAVRLRVLDLGKLAKAPENKRPAAGAGTKKKGDGEGSAFCCNKLIET